MDDAKTLIQPSELDRRLAYRHGRSARLARQGLIPHILLPDGQIRFDPEVIDEWLHNHSTSIGTGVLESVEDQSTRKEKHVY